MEPENQEKSEVYYFDDYVLDAAQRELRLAGQAVTMQPKAFELLLYLLRNRHRAIDKDELQDALWPRSIVTETALTRCVMKARRAVGDDADQQNVIKTVHGHGYRFIAELTTPVTTQARAAIDGSMPTRRSRFGWPAIAAGIVALVIASWWYLVPPASGSEPRLAVLPVENATGDAEFDWVNTGMMALLNRMLEDAGIDVVNGKSIQRLAGDRLLDDMLVADGEFQELLARTEAATHVVGARLELDNGAYRLTYTLTSSDARPERRTLVGNEPTGMIKEVVTTLSTMVREGAPRQDRFSFITQDEFLNEAYARAMSLEYEGRFAEAQRLFQVIIEQNPGLFWPRYEYALCARYLRDFENAERLLIELRDEATANGIPKQIAATQNALGILYMNRRRNDEALAAFEDVVRVAAGGGELRYAAIAHQNLGLLAKNTGDVPVALDHMQRSAALYKQMDVRSLPGQLHNNLAGVYIVAGNLAEAEKSALAAIESFRLTGERLFESYALSRLASIYRRMAMIDEAEDAATRAMAVREELGDRRGTAASLLTLADIARVRGDLTRSHQYAQRAREIGAEIDDEDITVDALLTVARAKLFLDRPQEAAADFAAAEAIARNNGDRMNAFGARYGIAKAWIAIGDYDGAQAIADELLVEARENDRQREETAGLNLHADILIAREQWRAAIEPLEAVLQIAQAISDPALTASANANLGRCWLELGELEKATAHIDLVTTARPADADVLKLQAQLAATHGDVDRAVSLMADARTQAGEMWRPADDEQLEAYRAAAESSVD